MLNTFTNFNYQIILKHNHGNKAPGRKRTDWERTYHRHRTAVNKIKHIRKALEKAGGAEVERLKKRLDHWYEEQ